MTGCARFRISLLGDFIYEVYEQAGDRQCFSADFDLPQVLDWPTDSRDEYVWAIQRVVEHRLRPDLARPFFELPQSRLAGPWSGGLTYSTWMCKGPTAAFVFVSVGAPRSGGA